MQTGAVIRDHKLHNLHNLLYLKKVEWCACLQPSQCSSCVPGLGRDSPGAVLANGPHYMYLELPQGLPTREVVLHLPWEVGDASGQKLQKATLLAYLRVSPVSLWGAPGSIWPLCIRKSLWFVLSLSGIMFAAASAHPWCMTGFKNVTGF